MHLAAQSMYDTYSGFTVPAAPVLPGSEIHPSLYFTASDTAAVRNKRLINSYYLNLWNTITSNINSFKTKTASTQDESDRPRMAKYCAFGWIVNKDAAAKAKAIEALMIAYDNVPRTATSADFDGTYDEIYRATWLQNYCEAYDWIESQLTTVQDSTIRSRIALETDLLANNMTVGVKYAPRPHNHRSKPAYAIGTAALALSSHARALAWLDSALIELNTVTKYQYSADGIYREGNHYHIFAMMNGLPFLWQYKNVSGVDLFPYYKSVFENPVEIRFGRGLIHTFEDSYLKPFMTHMAAGAYTSTPTQLSSTAKLSEVMQWNFFNTYLPSASYTGATNDGTWDIEEYLLYDASIAQTAPDIYPTINLQYGETAFRRSWNFNDPQNRVLILHGVAEADNHNHPDELAVMFEAENAVMATAPGYGPDGTSDAKRTSWYLQPFANNIVTIDSAAATDPVPNVGPVSKHFMAGADFEYSEKQAVFANNASWNRGIGFPHKNYFVMRDVVQSNASRAHRWYMHARGTMSVSGINARWTLPADVYGSAAVFDLYAVSSNGASFTTSSGYVSFANGHEEAAPYVTLQNTGTQTQFFSILYPRATGTAAPTVVNISTSGVAALSIAYSDTTDIHLSQTGYASASAGGVTTDAAYGMVSRKSASVISYGVVEGTLLQYSGSTLLSSSERATLTCTFSNASKVYVDAESLSTTASLHVKLPFPASGVTSVSVNGVPGTYSAIDDSTIAIPGSTGSAIGSTGNGNWSQASTWNGGVIPTSADNVEIAAGDTVTVDASSAACNHLLVNGALTFPNTTGRALTVNGNVSVGAQGDFNTYQTGNPSGVLTDTITIKGDLSVASGGKFDMRRGTGASVSVGTVIFSGSANSTISLSQSSYSSNVEEFNSVTINKSGTAKVVLASGNLFMSNNNSTGPAVLTLTNGVIETGNNAWVHLSTASGGVTGGSVSSYVNGALGRGGNTGSGTSRSFEIGDANGYRPVIATTTAGIGSGGYVVARCISGNANNSSTLTGGIDRVSSVRYYSISYKQGTSSTTSTGISKTALSYAGGDGVANGNTQLRVAYSTDTRATWTGVGQSIPHTTALTAAPTTITPDNFPSSVVLNDNSTFYAALADASGGGNTLPVEISDLTVSVLHSSAVLAWNTAVEINSAGFAIERRRSVNGEKGAWEQIGFVESHGTTNAPHQYSFTDRDASSGTVTYRLKLMDRDGGWEYSSEASVEIIGIPRRLMLSDNYPNPFNPSTAIEFSVPENGEALLAVYNPLGQKVAELFKDHVEAGKIYSTAFDGGTMSSGMYYYQLRFGAERIVKKMLLVK
jgi:hypothetical protein